MKAVNKNTFREIIKTKNRFLSILLICVIGVGFFSGVRATCGDMKVSANDYYDEHNLFDLRVVSTFGLTEDDVEAIKQIEGADTVVASKYTDMAVHYSDREYITRIFSEYDDNLNNIEIVDGREIQEAGECLINYSFLHDGMKVGDTVYLEDLSKADEFPLKYKEYKIAGIYTTPLYISKSQRGSTKIGDGAIDALMIVPEEDFTQDVYTEIYIKSEAMKAMQSYSDEYEKARDSLTDKLEAIGIDRSNIRYDEVIGKAQREIDDGEADLAQAKIDGQKELDDAKKELDEGKQKIEDGEAELSDAKAKIQDGKKQLSEAETKLADAKKEIESGKSELAENKTKLDDAKAELDSAKKQLDEGQKQLDEGKIKLDDSKKLLDEAQAEIDAKTSELTAGREQLEAAKAQYNSGKEQYDAAKQQLDLSEQQLLQAEELYGKDNPTLIKQREEFEAAKQQLEQTKLQLDAALEQITANEAVISAGEQQLAEAQKQVDEGTEQYNKGLAEYNEKAKLYENSKTQYEKGYAEYSDGLKQYNEGLQKITDGEADYNSGIQALEEKRTELEQGEKDYNQGLEDLEDAKQKYSDGLVEYNDGVEKYNKEIADAEKKLADAREKISDAGNAKWYIFSRDDNPGYTEYKMNAERIDKISAIFPVFFLLVAGLVCLTTMSRMVEEQRTQIGTLKALGYGRNAIMKHYMSYAVIAAAVGGVLGAAFGCILFPGVIMYAYSMMYNIQKIHFLYSPDNLIISIFSMTAAIALTVYFSCRKALRETPASLMRPKAPKAGKRIFLEKIPFIWNKFSFFSKVASRNLFRYKRRMFMTIVGIAGCTALSLTGFGLQNSINDIVDLQYNNIYLYSGFIAYNSEAKLSEVQSIYDDLLEYNPDTEYTQAMIKRYDTSRNENNCQVYVTCIKDTEVFEKFVNLHNRVSGEEYSISDGAVITEKAAKLLGADIGDEITLTVSDGVTKAIKISGITEQYVSHYLYISEELYKECFGTAPEYNMIYFDNGISRDDDVQAEFCEKMLKNDNIISITMNATSLASIHDTLKIMDLVVIVLIVSAGALAFVVLYNLINVNITERIREIATLKVLGFYDREVSSYIFRENIVLSLMGAAVGLGLGYALCMFVINTAEIDEMMFGRSIHLLSFVLAFAVTIAFSLIVNLMMTKVLKRVSMVESLKSVE